jgi:hypothetical protein
MNQPMPTGKRIVSKGEYVQANIDRTLLKVVALGVWAFAGVFAVIAIGSCVVFLGNMWVRFPFPDKVTNGLFCSFVLCLAGAGAHFLHRGGAELLIDAAKIDPGVPLTRANTADLPAPESLLRASEEPRQQKQAVLLRAATEGEKTPSEQLVRASAGEMEQL